MIALKIAVAVDSATPALEAVRAGLQPGVLLPHFAEVVAQEMQANFFALEARGNRLGGPSTGYFATAAANTDWEQDGEDRVVVFSEQVGLAMRYFGGTIRAGKGTVQCGPNAGDRTKYLTIPVTPEAYGKRACDIPGLSVLWGARGPYGLGRITRGTKATIGEVYGEPTAETHEVLFIFKEEVTIEADESILPSPLRLQVGLRVAFNDYMALLWEEAAAKNSGGKS